MSAVIQPKDYHHDFGYGVDYPPERIAGEAYDLIRSLYEGRYWLQLTKSDIEDLEGALATLHNIKEG